VKEKELPTSYREQMEGSSKKNIHPGEPEKPKEPEV
jgi:hypothetical protein